MLLVDTNIVAPLFVRSAQTRAVQDLRERDGIWCTEPFVLIEFCNVLATYQRARYITATLAHDCLSRAKAFLQPHFFSVTHEAALEFALHYRTTAYDGRLLALADQLRRRLVTEDIRLRAAAPALTQSLAEALAIA
jgi:predicted nucleic acid-binding protein